jgi:iron complex outermembrane recepter protein
MSSSEQRRRAFARLCVGFAAWAANAGVRAADVSPGPSVNSGPTPMAAQASRPSKPKVPADATAANSKAAPAAASEPWTSLVDGLPSSNARGLASTVATTRSPSASPAPAAPRRARIPTTYLSDGYLRPGATGFRLVQAPEPRQPLEPSFSDDTAPATAPRQPLLDEERATFGYAGPSGAPMLRDADRAQQFQSESGVASVTNDRALAVTAQPDLAEAISKDVLAVQTQWRSSISENPYIRGFKNRQVYAQLDGQFYEPVRSDLDTIVSKIDPGIVQDVIVIEGPYSVRYGPGFTFMDIVTRPTPRNQPAQYRTSTSWLPNGQQIYGRETVSGGSGNLGYRFSYGHRNGNDYRAGNNVFIPSHYNNGDMLAELGYNLSSSQRLEFNYRRLDQNHTAYPGQFFDVSSLQTNAFNLRYIDEDPTKPWTRLIAQGWFNQNSMTGNTFNSTKQPTVNAVQRALTQFYYPSTISQFGGSPTTNTNIPLLTGFAGSTTGNIMSTGGRVTAQFGEFDEVSLLTGIDARVLDQRVDEFFTISPFLLPPQTNPAGTYPLQFTTGMPRATMVNPGAFAEMTLPWTTYFRSKIGGRGDFVNTNANPNTFPALSNPAPFPQTGSLRRTDLSQNDGLYSFYMTNQLDLNEHWTGGLSFGEAQRPPSLIDRYADGMFLGIIQSGYRRVIGDPSLKKERNWQIDVNLNGTYENWRGYVRGYQSWVLDYITYSQNTVRDPTGAVLLNTVNTPLAELRGFEAFNSIDISPRITPFASAHYVYGVDQTLGQPLTQIPPLQGFAGIRFHDPNGGRTWGLETFATITREQDRVGFIRVTGLPTAAPVQIESRTPGWTTYNLRGYWNVSKNLLLSGGINNIFDKTYIQHLSLRTPPVLVFSPGISPYMSMEWIY